MRLLLSFWFYISRFFITKLVPLFACVTVQINKVSILSFSASHLNPYTFTFMRYLYFMHFQYFAIASTFSWSSSKNFFMRVYLCYLHYSTFICIWFLSGYFAILIFFSKSGVVQVEHQNSPSENNKIITIMLAIKKVYKRNITLTRG